MSNRKRGCLPQNGLHLITQQAKAYYKKYVVKSVGNNMCDTHSYVIPCYFANRRVCKRVIDHRVRVYIRETAEEHAHYQLKFAVCMLSSLKEDWHVRIFDIAFVRHSSLITLIHS